MDTTSSPAGQPGDTRSQTTVASQGGTIDPAEAQRAIEQVRSAFAQLKGEVHKVIVGQDEVVDQILMAIFCRGHALVVGVPGLAKTLLISTLAKTLSLGFSRVQFTPDLMPSDITGTEVIEEDKSSGSRNLRFVKGPIFANVILADEINRTPPKTQAALLEAMQEKQVTVGGMQHRLPSPFFVLATQNPIEQEGTYPLPEAQLDRFMFEVKIGYPTAEEELAIVQRTTGGSASSVNAVLSAEDIERVQTLVRAMPVAEHVVRYALRLVRCTRIKEPMDGGFPRPKLVQEYVAWGAGPRASEYIILGAKARAILQGATHVTPEHVRAVAKPVLRHRILTNFNAEADGITTDAIIEAMVRELPVEAMSAGEKRQLDAVVKG
ncbi:MAG: MoxR family ATPase [Phycisphaerales bacterium]|nr:MoxR family ATPase [Phycisphaerales bacterium]